MTGFGGYEGVKEIHRSGGKSVWTARRAGSNSAPTYAIRWLDPSATHWTPQETKREIAQFLERAQVQQKAAAGGKYWAPVYAHGESDGGAALVTRHYRRTAEELIQGKVSVSSEALYRIVKSIVRGLQELKRTCGRAHGALRASSVLLGGKRHLSKATVVLCSPAAGAEIQGQSEQSDFRPLGELIYQLVMHRPFRHGQLPLEAGEEWRRLGRHGDRWRELCGDLLDPSSANAPADLKALRRRLNRLAPAPIKLRTIVLSAVACGIVMGVGMLWILRGLDPQSEWEKLCYEYETWAEYFIRDVARNELHAGDDAGLAAIVKQAKELHDNEQRFDPKIILNKPNTSYIDLKDAWGELKKSKSSYDTAMAAAKRLQEFRVRVQEWLSENTSTAKGLQAALATNEQERSGAMKQLDALIVELPGNDRSAIESKTWERMREIAARMQAIKETTPLIDEINRTLSPVRETAAKVKQHEQARDDPLLARYPELAEWQIRSASSLAELKQALDQLEPLGGKLLAVIDNQWKEQGYPRWREQVDRVTVQMFQEWVKAAEDPLDPKIFENWANANDAQITGGQKIALALEATAKRNPKLAEEAKGLGAKFEQVRSEFKAEQGKRWTKVAENAIGTRLVQFDARLAALNKELDALREQVAEEELSQLAAEEVVKSPALRTVWQRDRQRALEADKLVRLHQVLREMDQLAPPKPAEANAPQWIQELNLRFDEQREKVLAYFADRLRISALTDDQIRLAELKSRLAALEAHRDALLKRGALLERMLEAMCAAGEGLGREELTLAQVVAALKAHGSDEDGAALVTAVQGLVERGDQVIAVAASDRATLATMAQAPLRHVLWSVWDRLRAQPDWPISAAELEVEIGLREKLKEAIAEIRGSAALSERAARLEDELKKQLTPTADRCVLAVRTSGFPASVVDLKSRFDDLGFKPKDLSERPRYYFELATLMQGVSGARVDDTQAERVVTSFRSAFATMSDPEVRALHADVAAAIARAEKEYGQERRAAQTQFGPEKALGWKKVENLPPDEEGYRFMWPAESPRHTLEFLRVTRGGRDARFVCTTEVSLGLFIDVLDSLARERPQQSWPGFPDALDMYLKGQDLIRTGPRVWERADRRIRESAMWIVPQNNKDKPRARELNNPAVPPPTRNHPLQHIKPDLAEKFAGIVGCEMATEADWLNASRLGRSSARENLADQAYGGEIEWLRARNVQLATISDVQSSYRALPMPARFENNDGSPWYAPVPSTPDNRFHDLIGNVAEWVKRDADYAVIGGSALTPPAPEGHAKAVWARPDVVNSDIGFRLAFTAPVQSLAKLVYDNLNGVMQRRQANAPAADARLPVR